MRARPKSRTMKRSLIHRNLDPDDSLGEVLFGLIMVLTVTIGARLVAREDQLNVYQLVVTIIGCNIAWGVIDAVSYVLNGLFHRSRRARFYRSVKNATNEADALAAIEEEFGLEDEPLEVRPEDRMHLYRSMLAVSTHAAPERARLHKRDLISAVIIFALVSATALPGVVPFLLVGDINLALHLSNAVTILLLFVVGYWWGRYTDARPWRVGLEVTLLVTLLVLVAVVMGG